MIFYQCIIKLLEVKIIVGTQLTTTEKSTEIHEKNWGL